MKMLRSVKDLIVLNSDLYVYLLNVKLMFGEEILLLIEQNRTSKEYYKWKNISKIIWS